MLGGEQSVADQSYFAPAAELSRVSLGGPWRNIECIVAAGGDTVVIEF